MQQRYYFIFRLNSRLYGINSSYVEEVLALPEFILTPETDCGIVGAFDLRGELLPVLNLDKKFGSLNDSYRLSDSLIVINHAQLRLGMIANQCLGIQTINLQEIIRSDRIQMDDSPEVLSSYSPEMIAGMILNEEQIWILNDVEEWISRSQIVASLDSLKQQQEKSEHLSFNGSTLQQAEHLTSCSTTTDEEKAIFRNRAESLKAPLQAQEQVELQPTVVFVLGDYLWGIDSNHVLEFVDLKQIIPVPCCPSHIIGNTNLRGEILTIVDIRKTLNIPNSGISIPCKVMVVGMEDIVIGIVVDRISNATCLLNVQDTVSATTALPDCDSTYLQGVVPYPEDPSQFIGILNLPNLLLKSDLMVDELV